MCFTTILFGILSASAVNAIYPEDGLIWTPWGILAAFQRHGGSGARAAAFFGGIFLAYAQISMNVLKYDHYAFVNFDRLNRFAFAATDMGVVLDSQRYFRDGSASAAVPTSLLC